VPAIIRPGCEAWRSRKRGWGRTEGGRRKKHILPAGLESEVMTVRDVVKYLVCHHATANKLARHGGHTEL
jgi:hypothetical protein